MIRPIIIVVNLLIALWVKLLSADPTAEVTAPVSVKAGESFVVNATIKPNGETGFLRFAMELQPGWKAEKIDLAGSSFYFEKNSANDNYSAKFLWSRVGETAELKISFRVIPPSTASGDYELPCKISHTVDNLPANIQLSPLKINVSNPSSPSANHVSNVPDSTSKPAATISVVRTVPTEPVAGEFLVDVVINKEDLVNFGKFQDSLPEGFSAKKVMTDGGTFSFENNMVKFYWPVLPKKSSLHIQYKIVVSPDMSGSQIINGYFSYVENESGKIFRIPVSTVTVKENPALVQQDNSQNNNANKEVNTQDNSQNNNANKEVNTQDNSQANNANKEVNTQDNSQANNANKEVNTQDNSQTNNANKEVNTQGNSQANNSNQQDNSQNSQANKQVNTQDNGQQSSGNSQQSAQSSSSSAGVTYRVQIAAMMRMVPVEYYYTSFNISGTINMEQVDGLNKYTHGSFTAYQDARNHREEMRSKGISDAFVTAYSNGKRVTVQEALMITSQKWIR